VTKLQAGGLAIAAWNLVDPDAKGTSQTITLSFSNLPSNVHVTIQRVDDEHGNVLKSYHAMGEPLDPTPAQVEKMNRESSLPAPESIRLNGNKLDLQLTTNAIVLVKLQP